MINHRRTLRRMTDEELTAEREERAEQVSS
jgi:hypothetical protein